MKKWIPICILIAVFLTACGNAQSDRSDDFKNGSKESTSISNDTTASEKDIADDSADELTDEPYVTKLRSWSFQYNDGTNDYSLFFSLVDDDDKELTASATVAIRIEDEKEHVLYEGIKQITSKDFSYYNSKTSGTHLYAEIRIDKSEIKKGYTSSGKVYLQVQNEDYFYFDEVNCSALYCLPIKGIKMVTQNALPAEIVNRSYDNSIESKFLITDVSYTVDFDSFTEPAIELEIKGKKTYESSSFSLNDFSYKLYDSDGYLVDSGSILLDTELAVGDKFKDSSTTIYDLTPGETYTLVLSESDY